MKSILTVAIVFFLGIFQVNGQDLVYKPTNPAFGGDTFNYQWLLSSAQAQNLLKDTRTSNSSSTSQLQDFQQTLNRQVLYQLTNKLVLNQFGESNLKNGTYSIGNYQIDVNTGAEGITISILDTSVGEQTQVIVPFY